MNVTLDPYHILLYIITFLHLHYTTLKSLVHGIRMYVLIVTFVHVYNVVTNRTVIKFTSKYVHKHMNTLHFEAHCSIVVN